MLSVVGALAIGTLSACSSTSAPTDEEKSALETWGDEVMAASGGGMSGEVSGAAASYNKGQAFPTPTTYTSIELRCKGTDRVQFSLTYTGDWGSQTVTQEIVCHDGAPLTPIAIPFGARELTELFVSATSPDDRGYGVVVPHA